MRSDAFAPSARFKANYAEIDWSKGPKPRQRDRRTASSARSDLPFPMVIRDHIAPTFNHADGRYYESASGFKNAVKEAGKRTGRELVIVGDDPAYSEPRLPEYKPAPDLKKDIKQAYDRVVGT